MHTIKVDDLEKGDKRGRNRKLYKPQYEGDGYTASYWVNQKGQTIHALTAYAIYEI
jgi:hypothetical protein